MLFEHGIGQSQRLTDDKYLNLRYQVNGCGVRLLCVYSGDAVLIGHKAVLQSDHNPTNTLYDAKRFIGKQFTSDELNAESSHYPFKVNIFSFICKILLYMP